METQIRFSSEKWAIVMVEDAHSGYLANVVSMGKTSNEMARNHGLLKGTGKLSIKQLVFKINHLNAQFEGNTKLYLVAYDKVNRGWSAFLPVGAEGKGQMNFCAAVVPKLLEKYVPNIIEILDSAFEGQQTITKKPTEKMEQTTKNPTEAAELLQKAFMMMTSGAQIDEAKVEEIVERKMSRQALPLVVDVKFAESISRIEMAHKNLPKLVKMVGAKMNVALIGEAGSGKSVAAVQVAKALNLNYFIFSFSQRVMPHDLVGFMSPITGDYVASNIRKAYELGGVLILDEFDRANTEVTILLNGMLANNDYMFPDKMVNKHEEFRIIACQNTIGVGGSKVYASARRQDGSTLNRFVKLDFNIDNDLELAVCGNTIITRAIQTIRKNVVKLGLDDILITPRQAIDGNKLVSIGFTNEEAIEHTCLVGLAPDVRKRILNNVEL